MINAKDNRVVMTGRLDDLIAEATAILTGIYGHLKTDLGEKMAGEILVMMGRIAVDPETMENSISDLISIKIPTPPQKMKSTPYRSCNFGDAILKH